MPQVSSEQTRRSTTTGWLVAYPEGTSQCIGFARVSVKVGASVYLSMCCESAVEGGLTCLEGFEYTTADGNITRWYDSFAFGEEEEVDEDDEDWEPSDPWKIDGASEVPPADREQIDVLIADPTSDINELITAVVAQVTSIGAIACDDVGHVYAVDDDGDPAPASSEVWRPAQGYPITVIAPWWSDEMSRRESMVEKNLAELAEILPPELMEAARRMTQVRKG